MDSVLRKLRLKKGDSKETDARKRLQKELFAYHRSLEYGFPHKPSAIAHDPSLGLLAIGTSTGSLKIYGKPGFQFSGQHAGSLSVVQIYFLKDQARLVTLCSDNSLHLWEMNVNDQEPTVDEIKSFKIDVCKAKTISCCCITSSCDEILIGTDNGTVYVFDVATFDLNERVYALETLLQKIPDETQVGPGAIEAILQHPVMREKFLIGFNRGLLILWNMENALAEHTYNTSQQLESVAFKDDGEEFVTSHIDGSYTVWRTNDSGKLKENVLTTPYGPFPCKSITKVSTIKSSEGKSFFLFSGGMPRSSYGDRHTVTVMADEKHVILDLSSKVVDFLTISSRGGEDEVLSLVILTDEELVCVDLTSDDWRQQRLPYLVSFHSSPVTCMWHMNKVPDTLWNKLSSAGDSMFANYSKKEWPVTGGRISSDDSENELLITAHEDGSLQFFGLSTSSIRLLYKLTTAEYFAAVDDNPAAAAAATQATEPDDGEWPPFRKVGTCESYADSPRLSINKIEFCPFSETLAVSGASGQLVILEFHSEEEELQIKTTVVNIADETSAWRETLTVKSEKLKLAPGFHPTSVVQLNPPAPTSALALNTEWHLIAVGSAYGFAVYDYKQNRTVYTKSSHIPSGTKVGVSRSRSFQMSLRDSFRNLRKRTSTSDAKPRTDSKSESAKPEEDGKTEEAGKEDGAAASEVKMTEEAEKPDVVVGGDQSKDADEKVEEGRSGDDGADVRTEETKPESPKGAKSNPDQTETEGQLLLEKSRESSVTFASSSPSKHTTDSTSVDAVALMSAIRCLYMAETFIAHSQSHTATLWVGTSGGQILIYQIALPSAEKRQEEEVQCTLAKEIHLKHRAPVVGIRVIDRDGNPLPNPLEVQHESAKAPDMSAGHRVVIASQEQLKIFSLPSLKANNKYKVSLHLNEAKICRIAFADFKSKSDDSYIEKDLVCMTSHGDVAIFNVPQLRLQRLQMKSQPMKADNVSAIHSCVLTQSGFGFYQPKPTELDKFSLSAGNFGRPLCYLDLKDGMRPAELTVKPEDSEVKPGGVEVKPDEVTSPSAVGEGKIVVPTVLVEKVVNGHDEPEHEKLRSLSATSGDENGANDSLAVGDITADSIKVHLSEEILVTTCHDVVENKMVVRTTEHTISDSEGVVRKETKTVVEEMSSCVESSVQEGRPVVVAVEGQ